MQSNPLLPSRRGRRAGFTLIELMVAVAVIALLAAVAMPSYFASIRKGRRAEAVVALGRIQQAEERWRSNNPNYTTTLGDLGITNTSTSSGYYTLSLSASTVAGDSLGVAYVATASGVDGTSQASDAQCRLLSVRVRNGNVEYAGCGSCSTFSYAPTNACWAR